MIKIEELSGHRSLAEEVAHRLRESIQSGHLQPGQRMATQELSKLLNVSAMPIREALHMLAAEGMVEMLPRRGFRVAVVTPDDLEDVYEMQAFFAGRLAQRAAKKISPATVARLRDIQRELEALDHTRMPASEFAVQAARLDFLFHRVINYASDAGRLLWFTRAAYKFTPKSSYEIFPEWHRSTFVEHPRIIDALEQRDTALAAKLMSDHTARGIDRLREHQRNHPIPFGRVSQPAAGVSSPVRNDS